MLSTTAAHLTINFGTPHNIVDDDLRYRKICTRWIQNSYCFAQQQRVEMVTQFLKHYKESSSVPKGTVTCHETWVHHCDLESKRQSQQRKHPFSPVKKNFNHPFVEKPR